MQHAKKLIEVALPLEAINVASAREKSIRHGHPSTLHLWWARRPLAAARAVIFAQMVDDPSSHPELFRTEKDQEVERERLFKIIEELVLWENTTNEAVLTRARNEIWRSWRLTCEANREHPHAKELFDPDELPRFHDPFAGGGALPLEAQRLGLEAFASDLNPVAVLINKAMIEIPPKFAGKPPVNAGWLSKRADERALKATSWRGAQGLAEDVRYYGQWMRDEAEKRIGHLYPRLEVTAEMAKARPDLNRYVGQKLTVIAWLWARTVKSPNPAFANVDVPLASTFMLSTKAGKEAYVEPVIEGGAYRFTVRAGKPEDAEAAKSGTKLARGANFKCVMSGTPIAPDYIYAEANAGRMAERMMAIVAEGERGRVYLAPTAEMEEIARKAEPTWKPDVAMPDNPRWFSPPLYGLKTFGDLFTPRQLVALTTFSDLVQEARERVKRDALAAGLPDDAGPLDAGGTGATAYADAVAVYVGETVSKITSYHCTLGVWRAKEAKTGRAFGRQAIPMVWDYPECNPFAGAGGDWDGAYRDCAKVLATLGSGATGAARQGAAQSGSGAMPVPPMISTDPPYYDNVGYADLSDFFYVWLRRSLAPTFPQLFATLAVPKAEELVANPYRHGGKENAEAFFLDGMTQAMHGLAEHAHPGFPVTIYYAFKQSESGAADSTASTGWETFLEAVLAAGFAVSGTWPMRTEQSAALKTSVNSLASSIILVCRPRAADAPTATRRDFLAALKADLPAALKKLQLANIAPVDLAQAAIGPGMAVFTTFNEVVEGSGKPMRVRDALALINQALDEVLAEQEGDFDADTQWTLTWFEQHAFGEGNFGDADNLSRAKNTSVAGLVEAGIVTSAKGRVRLLRPSELPAAWDPARDARANHWEMVHHLIRALGAGGEPAAGALAAKLGAKADVARELAYRLYTLCERKKRAEEARAYNGLVQSWPEIVRLAKESEAREPAQPSLLLSS